MLEWSIGAEEQLHELRQSFSTDAARKRFDKQLDALLKQLEEFPKSARIHPLLNRQDMRAFLVGEYRLTVLLLEDRTLVFSLVHAKSGVGFD
jgi:plasmid stabilization system protein ParE